MMRARLIIEAEPRSGAMNMALDEVLLESAAENEIATVRVYRWEEATLSLGHFQRDFREIEPQLREVPIVRRLSGGGAILHDRELTYSISLPRTHRFASDPRELYGPVHEAIRNLLAGLGINTTPRGTMQLEKEGTFLCFGRGDAQDLLHAEHKVLGSAQRRRRGAILQHGSLLLFASPLAPQFPGAFDFSSAIPPTDLAQQLGNAIAGVVDLAFDDPSYTPAELEQMKSRAASYVVSPTLPHASGEGAADSAPL